jgi:hypothetical protein
MSGEEFIDRPAESGNDNDAIQAVETGHGVNASPDILELLLRSSSREVGIDRKALAGMLLELAHNVQPELRAEENGVLPGDLRLEQLRTCCSAGRSRPCRD